MNDYMLCIFSVAITHEKIKDDDANIEEAVREGDISWVEDDNSTKPSSSGKSDEPDALLDEFASISMLQMQAQTTMPMPVECKMRAGIIRQHVMYWGDDNQGERAYDDGTCKQARELLRASKCTMVANCPAIACSKAGFSPSENASMPYTGPEAEMFDKRKDPSEMNNTNTSKAEEVEDESRVKGPPPADVAFVLKQENEEKQKLTPWKRNYVEDYSQIGLNNNEKEGFGKLKQDHPYNPGPPPQEIYCDMKRKKMKEFNLAPWEHLDDPDCVVGEE